MLAQEQNLHWMHDLRVQIQLLRGNIEMISEAAGGERIVWNRIDVSEHIDALMHCSDMVKTMLAERMEFESGPFSQMTGLCDLGAAVQKITRCVRAYAQGAGKRCECQVAGAPRIAGPRVKMERALYNLVTNAIFHTPQGTRIRVRAAKLGQDALVAVEDDGPGLSQEQIAVLQSGGGREGSGLCSVHCLVRDMGGRIFVRRDEGYNSIQMIFPSV